jgi:hypothetical protein
MTSARGVGPNPDIVALTGMAWTSGITNWVDKKFHIGFAPTFEVASGDNPAPGDYKTIDNSSDYPMIFDYKSGVLTFLVTPYAANGVDLTAKTGTDTTWHVYITGYTYLGGTLGGTLGGNLSGILEDISQQQFSDPIAIGTGAGDYLQGELDFQESLNLKARPDKDVTLDWTTIGVNTYNVASYMALNALDYCRLEMTVVGGGGGSLRGTIGPYSAGILGGGSGGLIYKLIIENVIGVIAGNVGKGSDPPPAGEIFNVPLTPGAPLLAGNGYDTVVSVNGKTYTATGGEGAALLVNSSGWYIRFGSGGKPAGADGNSDAPGNFSGFYPDIFPIGSAGTAGVNQARGISGGIKLTLKFFNFIAPITPIAGSIAIGVNAGAYIQQKNAIAIGHNAGQTGQTSTAIAIGHNSGNEKQGFASIAIGKNSGLVGQGKPGLLGSYHVFQRTTPGTYSFSTATLTGAPFQKADITIIAGGGASAFFVNPATPGGGGGGGGIRSLTLTNVSGVISFTVGAGSTGGTTTLGESSVVNVITNGTSQTYTVTGGTDGAQSRNGLAGAPGGFDSRGPLGALGYEFDPNSLTLLNGVRSGVEGGIGAGGTYKANQYVKGVDGGVLIKLYYDGGSNSSAIAIGPDSGKYNQCKNAIAIGNGAGQNLQGLDAIAIGSNAGNTGQQNDAIAIGANAGTGGQYPGSIAIGQSASNLYPGYDGPGGIAIGRNARTTYTGVAIGENSTAATDGGGGSLALGVNAFAVVPRSIVINGSGAGLTSTVSGFYVNPIRTSGAQSGQLEYNPSTKEITHAQTYAYSYVKMAQDQGTLYVRWENFITSTTPNAMAVGVWTCPKNGYWKMDATIRENGSNNKYFYKNDAAITTSIFLANDNYDVTQYRSMSIILLLNVGDRIGIGTGPGGVNYAQPGSSFTIHYIGGA